MAGTRLMMKINQNQFRVYLSLLTAVVALITGPMQTTVAAPAVIDIAQEQEGKFVGPGLAGLRVSSSLILFLSVKPVISEFSYGNSLKDIPVIVRFYNDSYKPIGEVTDHLSELPRVIMHDLDGNLLLDKYASVHGEPDPAAFVSWDWTVPYNKTPGPGMYGLILSYEGREVHTSFEIR
ncbi:MAG: hypothetical protein HN725_22560 [Alphaproteobacteria bacterium]|jgi:hypothetical protein|nr:hypothetical protein [Alphaproteobacteria bacterium]MBT4084407.1 hypothetical protein [Alphaproteobacteria bacterium]MBT4545629.1 hypothetical protein [Alphaproteobacteria bacterium]MBT7748086.1 hypothetical protein [Alphaproteobacteria bacterium]